MPRRVQDILPGDHHRGIREVTKSREEKSRKTKDSEPEREIPIHKRNAPRASSARLMPNVPVMPPRKARNRLKWLLIAIGTVVVVALVGFIASSFYSRATFTIVPKVIPISVNGTYVAQIAPAPAGTLSYQIVNIKGAATSTVPAIDGPTVSTKSSGKISLINSYGNKPVRLIAGTRFVSDAGMIYRLSSSLMIPGSSGTAPNIIPGKISAAIAADQAGQEYNLGKADGKVVLHILAYHGSPKFDTIYGLLTTDLAGGYVGTKKITNPTTVASSTAKLKGSLTAALLTKINDNIPDGYIMYPGNYSSAFAAPVVSGGDHNVAMVALQGTLYGIFFKKSDLLAKFSNDQSLTAFGTFGFTSPGLESLEVTITNLKDFSPDKKTSLVVRAKGDLKMIGIVPVDEITRKLEGASLGNTQDIFKSYSPVIDSGSGELVPPWAKIPNDPKRITVNVQGE